MIQATSLNGIKLECYCGIRDAFAKGMNAKPEPRMHFAKSFKGTLGDKPDIQREWDLEPDLNRFKFEWCGAGSHAVFTDPDPDWITCDLE
jgi:hypothetical protein